MTIIISLFLLNSHKSEPKRKIYVNMSLDVVIEILNILILNIESFLLSIARLGRANNITDGHSTKRLARNADQVTLPSEEEASSSRSHMGGSYVGPKSCLIL